jgi:biotin-(acetyl-CoA carboxylase) ligase
MPPQPRRSTGDRQARRLDLPPPFRPVMLREVGDAFAHASERAAALGAGALVFVGRFDLAEFAVVLEPEEPLATARLAFYAGMVALADALASLAPPEKPIAIDWPDAIRVDGGLIGGGRLGWPAGCDDGTVPEWLVFGVAIRTVAMSAAGAGRHPPATALAEEGFAEASAERLAETFARYFMSALERWREGGFALVARDYAARLSRRSGTVGTIDESGDLRLGGRGRSLAAALATVSWLDPETGGPRL